MTGRASQSRRPSTSQSRIVEKTHSMPLVPRDGVLCLCGYGLRVAVERGHLVVEDGIGAVRRSGRFHPIQRSLRRLVVVGHTGTLTLEAIRWLQDAEVVLLHLDSDGRVLAVAGPTGPDHPTLRRAQARAVETGLGIDIMRRLLTQKLNGQQEVLRAFTAGQLAIPQLELGKRMLRDAPDFVALRATESRAALAYWTAWRGVPVQFGRKDIGRMPAHWQTFGSRTSVLTSSPRLAVNPANAILNYLYAILEAEARIALLTVGCDPGVGIQHADQRSRDSMACDVMEAIRPDVDAYLLDVLASRVFRREAFFETREGGCRLMSPIAAELSGTAPRWAARLAPVVEAVAQELYKRGTELGTKQRWTARQRILVKSGRDSRPLPTPLTERNRSKGRQSLRAPTSESLLPESRNRGLIPLHRRSTANLPRVDTRNVIEGEGMPRDKYLLTAVLAGLEPLTRTTFMHAIIPALRSVSSEAVAKGVGLSVHYCAKIRAGRCTPGRKHWETFRQYLLTQT
jgi:CRISPR-associated endonuclease Cas1